MDRLFQPLLVVGLIIAGLGAATAVSIYEQGGPTFNIPSDDEDLVDEEALTGFSPSTAPPPTPSAVPARDVASKPGPVSRPAADLGPGPREPRSPGDGAEGGGANPPGSGDIAVGVGPDINDGQGLPANPAED